ncbi:hypothetical protein ACVDG5_022365 [Mesorhizobium sp. ORM6]
MDAINRAAANCFEFFASMDERLWLALASLWNPMQPPGQYALPAPASQQKIVTKTIS